MASSSSSPLAGPCALQSAGDELPQRGEGELLGERPHPAAPGERTAVDRGADELAGEQGVAQRAGPQEVEDLAVDRPAQRLAHQPVENGPPERLQVEPFAQPVLPQPDDRVGDVLATPHRGQHPQAVLGRELVHQCGRGLVQRVGVVDGEHRGLAGEDGLRPRARDAAASSMGSSGAKAPRGTTPDDRVAPTRRTRRPRPRPARPPRPAGGTCRRRPRRPARHRAGARGLGRGSSSLRARRRAIRLQPATSSPASPMLRSGAPPVRSRITDDRGDAACEIGPSARGPLPLGAQVAGSGGAVSGRDSPRPPGAPGPAGLAGAGRGR